MANAAGCRIYVEAASCRFDHDSDLSPELCVLWVSSAIGPMVTILLRLRNAMNHLTETDTALCQAKRFGPTPGDAWHQAMVFECDPQTGLATQQSTPFRG